ncbi:FAD-dependent oxidoreductase [Agreia sp. VKM Ac-1783]|uniref:FAD-dependent oxidoreductase n=1 Tax=Agreia sp. VKM Ac-1783 TaxID=1938889 RepID=UPI000A2AC9F8|nr:FAD-dependent oxidoreductase [Agreia sp. VKM Ac-1783]SMQ68337.1 assimilatory nitrate reductase (NADH) beta subunit [Agreia sp. VKM Ac-1783]
MSESPLRVVLIGYGPVGARLVDELLPAVSSGLVELTVVGAETDAAYNRVLVAELAVGRAERESLDLADPGEAVAVGVSVRTGVSAVSIERTRRTVTLSDGSVLPYDRIVLATGARANVPTLAGVTRLRYDHRRPSDDASMLDSAEAPLPRGVTALRDLADADTVARAVRLGQKILVLGAGVLGMELALAAAEAGAEVGVVYHGEIPMARQLDRGAGLLLARAARHTSVSMISHSPAESVIFRQDPDGVDRFDALVCADGKQISADLLVLSCGVGARSELARLCGLDVATGILVDERLTSWSDDRIHAIGDCAQIATRPKLGDSQAPPRGAPSGLIGPGWRQADWLARSLIAAASGLERPDPLEAERSAMVMLKASGIDVVAVGDVSREPLDDLADDVHGGGGAHTSGCLHEPPRRVSSWMDAEHGRYVKMITLGGVLDALVCVGMPRAAAELTLLYDRRSELPTDRSVLLRHDGPDFDDVSAGDLFAEDATVCWCNAVTVGAIATAADAGHATVACIGKATRAGTGCGGCRERIAQVLERQALSTSSI